MPRHCAGGCSDPPSAETPSRRRKARWAGLKVYLHFRCRSILLSILYTATIHAYLVQHIDGPSYCDHHRVQIRVVVTNSLFDRNSLANRVLAAAEQAEVLACISMPTISRVESCGMRLSCCCRNSWMAVLISPWSCEAAGGPALRSPTNKMIAGGLL
jgi:hypothetical protein